MEVVRSPQKQSRIVLESLELGKTFRFAGSSNVFMVIEDDRHVSLVGGLIYNHCLEDGVIPVSGAFVEDYKS